ncbi:hypothetical protein [Thalassospira sp.]|uniref:hypothetical protein n=1 Tax=Thalassospira sp. TaxID=1912094 RepID=UPI001B091419|nr:hypothetical protein [Thalassospira sp.]MBO6805535.1 hypothetical protein [Thalassospira sp.]MBO6842586.1 hypothetical protein [Thalassospira sp.]
MQLQFWKFVLMIGLTPLINACENTPEISYDAWQAKQAVSEESVRYTTDKMVKINLNWSRIGPFSRYNTRLRANAFSGLIDIYGAQTCLGKYVRDDRLSPAHGWWEIVCPDESYAAGNFRIDVQGNIQGVGTAINGEDVSFALAIPN